MRKFVENKYFCATEFICLDSFSFYFRCDKIWAVPKRYQCVDAVVQYLRQTNLPPSSSLLYLFFFFAKSPKCLFTRWKNEKWHSIETHKFARSTCGEEQPSQVSPVPTLGVAVLPLRNMEIENDCHWCVNWLAANKYIIFICFIFYYLLAIYCLLFNIDEKKKLREMMRSIQSIFPNSQ